MKENKLLKEIKEKKSDWKGETERKKRMKVK